MFDTKKFTFASFLGTANHSETFSLSVSRSHRRKRSNCFSSLPCVHFLVLCFRLFFSFLSFYTVSSWVNCVHLSSLNLLFKAWRCQSQDPYFHASSLFVFSTRCLLFYSLSCLLSSLLSRNISCIIIRPCFEKSCLSRESFICQQQLRLFYSPSH